jgi:hypothetical protein
VVALVREISKSNPRPGQPYVGQLSREVFGLFGQSHAFGRLPTVFSLQLFTPIAGQLRKPRPQRWGGGCEDRGFHLGTREGLPASHDGNEECGDEFRATHALHSSQLGACTLLGNCQTAKYKFGQRS